MYKQSGGEMLCKDIASALNVSDSQIRNWKAKDKWDDQLKKNTVAQSNDAVAQSNKDKVAQPKPGQDPKTGRLLPGHKLSVGHGAPEGNQNAKGNKGGPGAPKGNQQTVKHGFFSKIFPDDKETKEILAEIQIKSPLEILWDQIQIQYLAIARAQKIMFVNNHEDLTKILKRQKESATSQGVSWEKEYELQFAWDKQSTFLQAQSRAMQTLERLIARYEEIELATEEQRIRIEKLKAEVDKIKNPVQEAEIGKYIDALKGTAQEVWSEEAESDDDKEDDGEGGDDK